MFFISTFITEILILCFLIITYVLSGYEKINDWKETVSFTKNHFKSSPLKKFVPFLLSIILVIELIASIFMLIGIFQLSIYGTKSFALFGIILSALTLIFLLIGQRLAKDYVGSTSLTVYFILTIFGVYLLNS